ncbi:hypothetical protein CBL_00949 [Carabus blaptoides fortunei]
MWKCVNYLREPLLVANIQNFFGIELVDGDNCVVQNSDNVDSKKEYTVKNKFWYFLFLFGTALGDEVFYGSFIPFWFWNIDGAVGRRVVLVWTIVMYIGQGIKDIVRWPRPGPPVVRLQSKWALEYGMPSTHAMVAVSIPFSVLLYTMDRYQYNTSVGIVCAVLWCSVVCMSRLYLGMHTVLDIIVGLALAILLMIPLVPLVDKLDNYLLTNSLSPIILLVASILMIVYYPSSDKWTPTRGDTTMVVSVCVGLHIGAWTNYQLGHMTVSELTPPYTIIWPTCTMLGLTVIRTMIGFGCVLATQILAKVVSYNFCCALLRQNAQDLKNSENTLQNKHKTFVELCCKYITCSLIGFNTLYSLPNVFRLLRIERPTFYTEL